MKSGRNAGKTRHSAQLIVLLNNQHKERDIIVTRSSYSDIKGSLFQEILTVIDELGMNKHFKIWTAPMRIKNLITGSYIEFLGLGGSDLSRTRGFKPKNKLSMLFVDECQQLPGQGNLDQALATFRRHFDTNLMKVIIAFNPEPQSMHWLNEYYRMQKLSNPDYLCIESSYKDIAGVLNYEDIRAIEMERLLNYRNWEYVYMGVTNGLYGSVYHTFDRYKHYIPKEQAKEFIRKVGIHTVIFGTDGATTRDATCITPIFVLMNGRTLVADRFYHDPKKHGALSNEQLMPIIKKYIQDLHEEYNLGYNIPKYFSVDPASADLRVSLTYHFSGNNYNVFPYGKKDILKMANVVQSAFSRNMTLVIDCGGYKNYVTGRFEFNEHPLVNQLESVIWAENGMKFDDTVPNDCTDGLTYGLNLFFNNPDNLYLPDYAEYYHM
jgi:PBSX family phage terminase large subunit